MPPRRERRELDPLNSLWDCAAVALLRLRKDRGLSHEKVGDYLGINRSNVARIELGETPMKMEYAQKLDEWWFTNALFTGIVKQALGRHDSSWGAQRAAIGSRAVKFLIWEATWIPGLFQTPEYNRATHAGCNVSDVEGFTKKRMKEQEVLTRRPLIRCLLDESVLRQPVGGAKVMYDQLAHLLKVAEEHSVRVVPTSAGAHNGRNGSFWIMTGADNRTSVYSESPSMGRLVKDTLEVRQFGEWFDEISDLALSRSESLNLIRRIMEGFAQ